MFSEMTEKDKCCMILLIYGIKKIIEMNAYAKQKQIHRYRKPTCSYQRGEGQIRDMTLTDTNYYG